ncbi:MAG: hypothetical protein CMJ80_06775 [Planctomycetaceae bacterium]|nr:hypothetical protein [Planctomycetaceae bacterium]
MEDNNFIWGCLLFCLAPFFFLAFFAYPTLDDYSFSWQDPNLDGYLSYAGPRRLWIAGAVRYLHATTTHMKSYWANACAVLILHFLAILWTMRLVFRHRLDSKAILFWSLCFSALLFVNLPDPANSVYWATGAMAYHPGSLITPIVLIVLLRLMNADNFKQRTWWCLLSLVLVTVGMFTHWPTIAAVLCIASCCLTWSLVYQNRTRPFMAIIALSALCCLYVVATAPGNDAYIESRGGPVPLAELLGKSVISYFQFLGTWVLCPSVLLATPLFIWALWRSGWGKQPAKIKISFGLLQVFVAIFIASQFCVVLLSYYGALGSVPGRVYNVLFMNFVFAWIVFLSIAALLVPVELRSKLIPSTAVVERLIVGLFVVVLLCAPNMRVAADDILTGRCFRYHHQLTARESMIKDALTKGIRSLSVPQLTVRPQLLSNHGLATSPDEYPNPRVAKYWGLDSIRLEEEIEQ